MGSSEGSSKGPSHDDPGIAGAFGGGGPSTAPTYMGSNTDPGGSGPPTQGTVGANIGAGPSPQFGVSSAFSADSTATSGAGGSNVNPSSIFASLENPAGGSPGGGSGGALDNMAAGGTPGGGVTQLGASTPATGGISAAGLAPPTGATGAPLSLDPTQGQGQPQAPAAGGAVPSKGGSGGLSLENIVGSAEKSLTSNPLGLAAAGGGLLYSVMSGKQISDNQKALQEQAGQLSAQGKQMASYLSSGTLPAGLKAGLDQATASAKAKVISNYAAQGMSTDPSQNSTLAQQLALIDQQAIITTAQIGQQLFSTGVQESGLASGLYSTLANLDQTQTQRVGQAISSMAAALSPNRGGLSLSIGK